jgi:tetratricopeptide (TPR) repeat protein
VRSSGNFSDKISLAAFPGAGLDGVLTLFSRPQTKAIMMFCNKNYVFGPCSLGSTHPLFGVQLCGIEHLWVSRAISPLSVQKRVGRVVDEDTELKVLPLDLLRGRLDLGEVLEAQGDLSGARSQFEQALAIAQKIGASVNSAETQEELAHLAIEENHPEQAEGLLRIAIAEFDKEKSDPDSSSAYTLLSRALLRQGKLDEARQAALRGDQLSLTSSDPALKLLAAIQLARVEMASAENGKADPAAALRRLQSAITTANRLGYYKLECEARLALGELELKINSSAGRKRLKVLASETHEHGLELLARQAEGAASSGTPVAANHSGR